MIVSRYNSLLVNNNCCVVSRGPVGSIATLYHTGHVRDNGGTTLHSVLQAAAVVKTFALTIVSFIPEILLELDQLYYKSKRDIET